MMGRQLGSAVVCLVCAFACAGEKGDTGAQGEPGATGANGKDGQDGAQGPAGVAGPAGIKGDEGPIGIEGPAGPQGVPGDKGDKGDKGDPGTSVAEGGAGGESGTAEGGSSADAEPRVPGFVLLDKDGQPAHAIMPQNYYTAYGDTVDRACINLLWIDQRNAAELQLHLATGTFEPCYDAYANFTAAAKSSEGVYYIRFHSTDCTGPGYAPMQIPARMNVAGVLQEPHGAALAPIGAGTGEPASQYDDKGACKDVSAEGPFNDLRAYVPVDPEFKAAFNNPPYSVKIVY